MGARDRWASLTMRTIWAKSVSLPTRSAFITNDPVPLTVPPVTGSPVFFYRDRLAGDHRLIDALAFEHFAVDRNLLTGPHAQPIARLHLLQRNIVFGASASQATRRLRGKAQKRANCTGGLTARSQLQNLPQQHQRDNYRRCLEIHIHLAAVTTKRFGKQSGGNGCDNAESVGGADADRNEREHIRLRWTIDCQPRTKNGSPPHRTTGVARAS